MVVTVGSDPEPDDYIVLKQPECSPADPDPNRVNRLVRMYTLELKAGMSWVLLPDHVALPGTALNLFRQLSKEVPKFPREM